MKNQINLLNQLQELVLTRDEHHQTGDGSHTDTLSDSIDTLSSQLDPQPKALYDRLYKKDHIVMSPMSDGCCAVCGMRLPISQVQQVRMAKTIQTCSSCGRMLFDAEEDAPRYIGGKPAPGAPRKTGIGRFSAAELMISNLSATTPEEAIAELAKAMSDNKFVSNPEALVKAAMEREQVLSTAMGKGLAFPHVRGAYEKTLEYLEGKTPWGTHKMVGVKEGFVDFVQDDENYIKNVPAEIREKMAALVEEIHKGKDVRN